ncbi:hypothetical protein CIL05_13385 [Virgibacillus profundi]|uniref:TadE-like domain-containing protein n=1 Tax=Virgibacillus profundi TaxID=2024555 RepID=A0A2A2IC78_9BACI|nr:TadE family protein [Virgibacillus profundi]PAV28968.1 hypothetical protein CIL05_13385 [Virgibacillus profundi]PXY53136.1 pilus assembly protein [Virgibacillus profundi]
MKPFMKGERGSFTIESTLVFPALLLFTLAGVFFCIVIFQMGTANYVAQKASSQVAYTWNNSYKDLTTGEFGETRYTGVDGDPLYWRITDDGVLEMFGIEGLFQTRANLKQNKLRTGATSYSGAIDVELEYKNYIVYSEVQATATTNLFMPSFLKSILGRDQLDATSTRVVSDTPELIRTFNFSKYIWMESGLGNVVGGIKDSINKFFGGG